MKQLTGVECAGQGERDCSISSVLSESKLEVRVKADDNQVTWVSHVVQYRVKTTLPFKQYCITTLSFDPSYIPNIIITEFSLSVIEP